jgi:hypothetical protein
LVHRNGLPSNKSEYIKVDRNMINDLMTEVHTLINHIIEKRKFEIEKWLPDLKNRTSS